MLNDVTAHAEMQAITAANYLGGKYLKDCTMYVTGTLPDVCWSLVESDFKIVFGASDESRGFSKMGTQLHPKLL
jgi:tRNA(adenine34) deaminase